MLVLLSLLRAWAISKAACAPAFRESLVCRCHKQSTRISFRAEIMSQVSPVPPHQCDPWADCRLMTPTHPQAAPIIQPRTSLADLRQRIPSLCNTFSLPYLFIYLYATFSIILHSKSLKSPPWIQPSCTLKKQCTDSAGWVTTTDSAQGWEGKPELLTQQPGSTVTSNVPLAMSTGEKDAVAQSRSLPVCAMGLQPIPHHPSRLSPSCTRALPSCTLFFLICYFCRCSHY